MNIKRLSLALMIALVVAIGSTYALYSRLQSQRAGRSGMVKVVAAAEAMEAGTGLGTNNLTLVDWPVNLPITGAFTKASDIVGRSLIYPVSPQQPILERDLAKPGSGIGLTVKIPEGMRATSVRSNEIVGVAGFLYPGSHVDVLVTYKAEGSSPITQTILQDVEVLTAGQTIEPDPKGKPETVNVVTLLLTPQDSQKVVLAGQQGTVQFVLRNGADKGTKATQPVVMTDMINSPGKPVPAVVHVTRAPKPAGFYAVETISGEKRSTEKF